MPRLRLGGVEAQRTQIEIVSMFQSDGGARFSLAARKMLFYEFSAFSTVEKDIFINAHTTKRKVWVAMKQKVHYVLQISFRLQGFEIKVQLEENYWCLNGSEYRESVFSSN